MAIAVERSLSREISGLTGKIGYVVMGAATELEALAAVLAAAPATLGGLYLKLPTVRAVSDDAGTWAGEASYGVGGGGAKILASGEVMISGSGSGEFQIRRAGPLDGTDVLQCLRATNGGKTTHMTHGYTCVAYGTDPPDFGGAINATPGGDVQGVDVPPLALNNAAITITAGAFSMALDQWECGFSGLQWQERQDGLFDLAWGLAVSREYTVTIPGVDTITVAPWEYLWTLFVESDDATAKFPTKRARASYLHRVYDDIDFAALGTGVIT